MHEVPRVYAFEDQRPQERVVSFPEPPTIISPQSLVLICAIDYRRVDDAT